jgi:hypothetical protein
MGEKVTFLKMVLEQKDPKINQMTFYEVDGNQRRFLHTITVQDQYVNALPACLAYQASETDINVLTFISENTLGPMRAIRGAKLLHGDYTGLTTCTMNLAEEQ